MSSVSEPFQKLNISGSSNQSPAPKVGSMAATGKPVSVVSEASQKINQTDALAKLQAQAKASNQGDAKSLVAVKPRTITHKQLGSLLSSITPAKKGRWKFPLYFFSKGEAYCTPEMCLGNGKIFNKMGITKIAIFSIEVFDGIRTELLKKTLKSEGFSGEITEDMIARANRYNAITADYNNVGDIILPPFRKLVKSSYLYDFISKTLITHNQPVAAPSSSSSVTQTTPNTSQPATLVVPQKKESTTPAQQLTSNAATSAAVLPSKVSDSHVTAIQKLSSAAAPTPATTSSKSPDSNLAPLTSKELAVRKGLLEQTATVVITKLNNIFDVECDLNAESRDKDIEPEGMEECYISIPESEEMLVIGLRPEVLFKNCGMRTYNPADLSIEKQRYFTLVTQQVAKQLKTNHRKDGKLDGVRIFRELCFRRKLEICDKGSEEDPTKSRLVQSLVLMESEGVPKQLMALFRA